MKLLATISGISPLNATAFVASVGKAETFGRNRDIAALLGLVPRQMTTGGEPKLTPFQIRTIIRLDVRPLTLGLGSRVSDLTLWRFETSRQLEAVGLVRSTADDGGSLWFRLTLIGRRVCKPRLAQKKGNELGAPLAWVDSDCQPRAE